jgi:hypothetical protein
LFSDFVDASARMGASDFRTKHVITAPVVTFNESHTRAVAETNAIIVGENVSLHLGCNGHNRFIDRIEKREGLWKIVDRLSAREERLPCQTGVRHKGQRPGERNQRVGRRVAHRTLTPLDWSACHEFTSQLTLST